MKEIAMELGETSLMLRRFFDREVGTAGVTSTQWRVLLRLAREPGLKQVELAERLDVEPITACRIVDRLEESGLVERRRDPADRRVWRLAITPAAEPLVERLRAMGETVAQAAFAGLSGAEIEQARSLLARVRDNVSRAEEAQRVSA